VCVMNPHADGGCIKMLDREVEESPNLLELLLCVKVKTAKVPQG
jgi:hypothetical protein